MARAALLPLFAAALLALPLLPVAPADPADAQLDARDAVPWAMAEELRALNEAAIGATGGAVSEGAVSAERVFLHDASGLVAGSVDDIVFRVSDTGRRGPEPSVGYDSAGRIFFQDLTRTVRSLDQGLTWADVTPSGPTAPIASPTTYDPLGWLDVDTDRWYSDQLRLDNVYGACSWAVWTDFAADTWNGVNPAFCATPPIGAVDHQKINTGPVPPRLLPVQPPTLVPYENAVYFAWNAVPGSRIAMSLDGGQTFPLTATMIQPGTTCSGGLHGRVRSFPDGTLLLPKRDCGGPIAAWSDDFNTWHPVKVGASVGSTDHRKNPDIAIDTAGNAYMFWSSGTPSGIGAEPAWMSVSTNRGVTWSAPVLTSPPNVLSTTFHSAVAGAPGKVAVMYYGNDHSAAAPDHTAVDSRWHAYVTFSLNALDANPTWTTVQLDTDSNPIQIGPISTNSHHAPSGSRNLLDFNDLVLTPDGRVVAAYADGCTTRVFSGLACADTPGATMTQSRDSEGMAAILLGGISLN